MISPASPNSSPPIQLQWFPFSLSKKNNQVNNKTMSNKHPQSQAATTNLLKIRKLEAILYKAKISKTQKYAQAKQYEKKYLPNCH